MEICISHDRAKMINVADKLFRSWSVRALERGVCASTIDRVEEDWKEGHFKLILDIEDWAEIQS